MACVVGATSLLGGCSSVADIVHRQSAARTEKTLVAAGPHGRRHAKRVRKNDRRRMSGRDAESRRYPLAHGCPRAARKEVLDAAAEERKAIWREQLLKLHLFREVRELLQREPRGEVSRELVLESIILRMPQENYEKAFETFIGWSRFGVLFAYDETADKVSTQDKRPG
jgi:C-terminal AAA-associated domain